MLIIATVAALFIITLSFDIGSLMADEGTSINCFLSLYQGKSGKDCEKNDIRISGSDVMVDSTSFSHKNTPEKDLAKRAVAEVLIDCLARGGGTESGVFVRSGFAFSENVCLECGFITTDNAAALSGLDTYLKNTKPKGKDKTYWQTLTSHPEQAVYEQTYTKIAQELGIFPASSSFEPGKKYTIFFLGQKKGDISNAVSIAWDILSTSNLLELLKSNDGFFVFAMESALIGDEDKGACHQLVN